jgi:hypothetical protein
VAKKGKQMNPIINTQQLSKIQHPKSIQKIPTPNPQTNPFIAAPSSKVDRLIFKIKIVQVLRSIGAQSLQSEHPCLNHKIFLLKGINVTKKMRIHIQKIN